MATQVGSGPPSSARPTGTVTFLFSDIEGSTTRWEQYRDAMAEALARHDTLMRARLEARGAYVFKTIGDAFCAAFTSAQDAMAAALDAQRALVAEDFSAVNGLRVRMALHSGSVDERDGDYFGPTVNRVARLLAIGHGGQVLVSRACTELLQSGMPTNYSLRDLGAHRLKDLAQPEHVHQLLAPDLPETFPALLSLNYLSNNLPAQLTSFLGREDVVKQIEALLQRHRLVTLVGTGGAGKTRCAIQVGAELVDGSGDGVWLAELAPISDPSLVASVIARTLSVQESPNRPMLDTLLAYLKRKRLLLILDNCEHVMEQARIVVAAILRACADVHILATSREGLSIAGEQLYRMPSLSVPSVGQTLSPQDVLTYGAPLLFLDRAFSVDSRLALTDENLPHIAEICRRLDGIPLAIELAAARVSVLSPQQLALKLDERFRVLTRGDRSALPRHQTMHALIDWSYDLLSNEERALFRKLSIYAGDFTLESAAAVCGADAVDEIAILDLLSSLVDKSLVQAEAGGIETRYRLLESTRQYARQKLMDCGEYEAVARAHAAAYLALAEELDEAWETTSDRAWLGRAVPELENFRAAVGWAFGARGDVLMGERLTAALRLVWNSLATAEGLRWVQRALAAADEATPKYTIALLELTEAQLQGTLAQFKGEHAAAERAVSRYRELGDPRRFAFAQQLLGTALAKCGKVAEGEALLRQAVAEARALGVHRLTSAMLIDLAGARRDAGDVVGALPFYAEALAIARPIGAERVAALVAVNIAEVEFRGGDAVEALRLAGDVLPVFRALKGTRNAANAQCNMAAYLLALARYEEARKSAREALAAARDTEFAVYIAFALQHLAAVGALRPSAKTQSGEEHACAARVLGYVDARLSALEGLREYTEQQEYDKMLPALRDALGADGLAELMAEGSTWSEDQAVAEAMLI
jgi:predicted ATPase/class 3 adenylate cyclase